MFFIFTKQNNEFGQRQMRNSLSSPIIIDGDSSKLGHPFKRIAMLILMCVKAAYTKRTITIALIKVLAAYLRQLLLVLFNYLDFFMFR